MKNLYGDRWISFSKSDTYGGYDLRVGASPDLEQKLIWLENFMKREESDRLLRESDPNVKAAWDQYRMAVAVVSG